MQLFNTVDVLRLEVERDWPALPNLVPNPSGEMLGVAGWTYDGIVIIGPPPPSPLQPVIFDDGLPAFSYTLEPATGPTAIFSTPAVYSMTPEQTVAGDGPVAAARVTRVGGDNNIRLRYRILWWTYTLGPIPDGTSDWSSYVTIPGNGPVLEYDFYDGGPGIIWIGPPAGAYGWTSLEVEISDTGAGGGTVVFRDSILISEQPDAVEDSIAAGLVAHPGWLDILGPTLSIKIERSPLNAVSLVARIRDSTLDPANVPVLRKGKRLRAMAPSFEVFSDSVRGWEPIFTGAVDQAQVVYDLAADEAVRADISLTAVDPDAVLAATDHPDVSNVLTDLHWLLAGTHIPVRVNGQLALQTNGVAPAALITIDGNKLLDQLILIRDTTLALVWVDRFGFVRGYDEYDDGTRALVDEEFYNASAGSFELGFNTEDCINEITFTIVSDDGAGGVVETKYGPYTDEASIAGNGRHPIEFRLLGPDEPWSDDDEAALRAYASAVFASNGFPRQRVKSVTATVMDPKADFDLDGKVLRDIYDKVQVHNDLTSINETARIVSLSHNITPAKWLITYGLVETGARPLPTSSPRIVPI